MGMGTRRAVGPRCSTSGLSSAKGTGIPLYRVAAVTASKLGLVWEERDSSRDTCGSMHGKRFAMDRMLMAP